MRARPDQVTSGGAFFNGAPRSDPERHPPRRRRRALGFFADRPPDSKTGVRALWRETTEVSSSAIVVPVAHPKASLSSLRQRAPDYWQENYRQTWVRWPSLTKMEHSPRTPLRLVHFLPTAN